MIDLARLLYIGVALLHYPEVEVWKMSPYKLLRLYECHKYYHAQQGFHQVPQQSGNKPSIDAIDVALGGF